MPLSEKAFGRTWTQVIVYDVLRFLARGLVTTVFALRPLGRSNYPSAGGVLVCSNHQSHLDPIVIGLTCDRRYNYVARKSLFRFSPFRWLIEFLDAIPIEREGIGIAGLKETLKRLKRGEVVLIFPEGTRTRDGQVGKIHPGFCALARRGKVPVVPIGYDGGFLSWPRRQWLPRWSRICICIGEPITPHDFSTMTDDELVAELTRRIEECFRRANWQVRR